MEEKAHGIILRTRPLTETSLIVHWLTREQGRLATVAKGARRAKSSFRGKIDLFFAADLSFVRSRRSELHTLREMVLTDSFPGIRSDHGRVAHAAYAVRLIELATETETPVPEFHALLADWLRRLDTDATDRAALLGFEWRLLALSGGQPDPNSPALGRSDRALLETIVADDPSRPSPSPEAVRELGRFLSAPLERLLSRLPDARAKLLFS